MFPNEFSLQKSLAIISDNYFVDSLFYINHLCMTIFYHVGGTQLLIVRFLNEKQYSPPAVLWHLSTAAFEQHICLVIPE